MQRSMRGRWVAVLFFGVVGMPCGSTVAAEEYYVKGANECLECHENDFVVWKKTKHYKNFKTFHTDKKTTEMLAKLGSKQGAKSDETCVKCHYTMVQKGPGDKGRADSGTSCESCHGPSSGYLEPHEKEEHRALSRKMGLVYSDMDYDIAGKCMSCHGLAREDIKPDVLAKLSAAGHSVEPDFELVRYSQGTLRHRFFPPDVEKNQEMTKAELARFFVAGQAAQLVAAMREVKRATDGKYKATQQERADRARQALAVLKSVPEAAALLAGPTDGNARKLVDAIRTKDLSAELGGMLPAKSTYK